MGSDILGVLLTVVLLAANAFFVGSEFALISARRDRLEALAEQGKKSAVTVIRAGEQLSLMLAGAQLGITICSILLGRVGEPAVAHLLEKPFDLVGIPDALLHTVSFVVALGVVVTLHVLLGEMVPKNIAIAGPEAHGDAADPALPALRAGGAAVHRVLQLVRQHHPARGAGGTQGRTRRHGVHRRTVRDDRRVGVGGSARPRGAHPADPCAADPQPRRRRRRGAAAAISGRYRCAARARARPWRDVEQALAETGYSRFPVADADGTFIGYLHIKDVLALGDDPDAVIDLAVVRPLPHGAGDAAAARRAVAAAPQQQPPGPGDRRRRRHGSSRMVALEDLVEDLVGTVRDGTHRV